jgi:vacuolar-type H+-ATPase subunit I/STV1
MDRKNVNIPAQMKQILRFAGWIFLILGLLFDLLGVLALPDGGLMFALPYFFLIPGIALTLIGGLMIFLARVLKKTRDGDSLISEQR